MSDPATSGDSAATAGAAFPAASSGTPAPAGSFGAKGSGLARGKRPSHAAASTAAPAAPSGYQPSALEVIRPQSEYKNPFTGKTSVAAPIVNEPAPQAAPAAPVIAAAPAPVVSQPVAEPAATPAAAEELFPFTPPAAERPAAPAAKAELNILPPEEVKRPAVSWGETSPGQTGEPRGRRDERPTFKPERRNARPFEPREPRAPREPGREASAEPRTPFARDHDRDRHDRPAPAELQKKSGGFFAWLKGLFGGSAQPEVKTGDRDHHGHDGHHHRHEGGGRRRHRGGRGGYQGGGENRGPRDSQPRDPRDYPDGGGQGEGSSGEQRFEGGGRRRRRGGRNRHRDDRGPRPEGQQGGGAI